MQALEFIFFFLFCVSFFSLKLLPSLIVHKNGIILEKTIVFTLRNIFTFLLRSFNENFILFLYNLCWFKIESKLKVSLFFFISFIQSKTVCFSLEQNFVADIFMVEYFFHILRWPNMRCVQGNSKIRGQTFKVVHYTK